MLQNCKLYCNNKLKTMLWTKRMHQICFSKPQTLTARSWWEVHHRTWTLQNEHQINKEIWVSFEQRPQIVCVSLQVCTWNPNLFSPQNLETSHSCVQIGRGSHRCRKTVIEKIKKTITKTKTRNWSTHRELRFHPQTGHISCFDSEGTPYKKLNPRDVASLEPVKTTEF